MSSARTVLCAVIVHAALVQLWGETTSSPAGLDRTAAAIALHDFQQGRLGRAATTDRRKLAADQGNVAILRDDGTLVTPLNRFDLANRSLTFTPQGAGYTVQSGNGSTDPGGGQSTAVTLTDDDSEPVSIGFQFPFYGVNYASVYLNTDGNLTFTSPDAESTERNLRRMIQGAPRISGLFTDLNPAAGGSVRTEQLGDRFLIWWNAVPQYGTNARSTFQIVLRSSGAIQFNYESVSVSGAVVGLTSGNAVSVDVVDLSQQTGFTSTTDLVAEVFSTTQQLDLVAASEAFYETHQDTYDALIFFADFDLDLGGAFAYEVPVRNEIDGIMSFPGDIFDYGSDFGSANRLAAIVNMGRMSQYPADPQQVFLGTNNTLSVLGQEFGHRWLAFVESSPPAMLGRDLAHWSFFMNTLGSVLEGNEIQDLGGGVFRTSAATYRYSPLDQYLMGLRSPAEVPSWFVVTDPSLVSAPLNFNCVPLNASCAPAAGVEIRGTRRDLTIQDVIATAGPRVPSSDNSQRDFAVAVVLITASGAEAAPKSVEQLDRIRQQWESFFVSAVESRATMSTELRYPPVTELEFSLQPNGSAVAETASADAVQVGYSVADSGVAVAVLQSYSGGHLVSEAAVAGSAASSRWVMYAERNAGVSTGIALVNPNDTAATIDFQLNDGQRTSLDVGPHRHLSRFLHEIFPSLSAPFLGTLTLQSSVPVAVVALRGTVNASGDFIIATIPLSSGSTTVGGSAAFPLVAEGGGYNTELILVNPGASPSSGSVEFSFDVSAGSGTGKRFDFSIPAGSVWRLQTSGTPEAVISGYARIVAAEGSRMPDATAMIRLSSNGELKSETAVPAGSPMTRGLMFGVLESKRRTGIAILNPASTSLQVTLTPLDRAGAAVAAARTITLDGFGRVSSFIDELIPDLPSTFEGTVLLEASGPAHGISIRGTTDSKNGFLMSTLPVFDFAQASTAATYLPQLVSGGEFATELLVMTPQGSSLTLQFFFSDGQPMPLPIRQ